MVPVFKANLTGFILAVILAMGMFYLLYMLAIILYATIILCFLLPFAIAAIFSFRRDRVQRVCRGLPGCVRKLAVADSDSN